MYKVQPEMVYKVGKTPVVVVDYRVLLFTILGTTDSANYTEAIRRAYWLKYLNNILGYLRNAPSEFMCIVVDDFTRQDNTYWRADYYSKYKANRQYNERPNQYFELWQSGIAVCEANGIPVFSQEGFEADDFAGAVARLARNKEIFEFSDVFLATSDGDWMQLVDDSLNLNWSNQLKWQPRLRHELQVLQYYGKKGYTMSKPTDVVTYKHLYGDAGDNIDPGTTTEVIDLHNPPEQPNICKLKATLSNWTANAGTGTALYQQANAYLAQQLFSGFA